MKKTAISLVMLLIASFFMIGADFASATDNNATVVPEKKCLGYSIIEAGLGVDCKGDTIKLVKTRGFYEVARIEQGNDE